MLLGLWEGRADSKGPSVDSDSHFGPSIRPRSISQNSAGPASCLFLPHHRQTGQGTDHSKKQLDPQRLELPLPPLAQTDFWQCCRTGEEEASAPPAQGRHWGEENGKGAGDRDAPLHIHKHVFQC